MTSDGDRPRDDGLAEAGARGGFVASAQSGEPNAVVKLGRHRRLDPQPDDVGADEGDALTSVIRVLVIDDDENDVLMLRDLLGASEQARFAIEHAGDLEDGLAALLSDTHDIALVAYGLATGAGLAPARLAARRGACMPVVLLADGTPPALAAAAVAAGAADVLEKEELDVERLERAIRIALARRRRTARLEGSAARDALTGLPGQPLFRDRLDGALARARRHRTLAAIMVLDLDQFGLVNRRFDRAAGDSLLRLMGARLQRQLRESDTLARRTADRFTLIVENLAKPQHARLVASKLLAAVATPVAIGGETFAITASAGTALFPCDASDGDELLALADAALRRAKAAGGNRCSQHDERQDGQPADDTVLAGALRQALDSDVLAVLFQPQVTLCSADLGLASLVRWYHGSLGVIEGERIRALAETAALTEPLTDWLIAAACRQAARWRAAGLPRLHVAVPLLSRRQLAWSGLARRLGAHLEAANIPPDWLELEIDETLLLDELGREGKALDSLRALGVRVAVDGFGSGPTSLRVLRDTPLTTVKLARVMLAGVPEDANRTLFAATVIKLGHDLQLRLVAEGIESQAQLQLLRAQGCDAVQSLVSCPPLPADACADWLRQAATRS